MAKLEGTCIIHLYHCYATKHPLSEPTMWSCLHTMSPPPPLPTSCHIQRHIKV